jgi:hypothetical protein
MSLASAEPAVPFQSNWSIPAEMTTVITTIAASSLRRVPRVTHGDSIA